MFIMAEKGIRHLPVLDKGELVDFLSMRDVVKGIVDGKDFLINQLNQYITGAQSPQIPFLEKNLVPEGLLSKMNQMVR